MVGETTTRRPRRILKHGEAISRIPYEMEAVAALGGRFLFLGAPGYPPLLDTLADPPPVLALLGDPGVLQPRAVAVVGARNASAAGRRIAGDLAEELAAR